MKGSYYNWQALKPRIMALARQGKTVKQTAEALGILRVTLDAALHRYGWRHWFPHAAPAVTIDGIDDTISGHARRRSVSADAALRRHARVKDKGDIDWQWVFYGTDKNLTAEQIHALDHHADTRAEARRSLRQLTYRSIARKMEISESAVWRISSGRGAPRHMDQQDREIVQALLAERKRALDAMHRTSPASVAAALGITVSAAKAHLR